MQLLKKLPEDHRKIVIFAHWDADGIASAVMLVKFLAEHYKKKPSEFKVIFPNHGRISIIDYLYQIPSDFTIITLDLALNTVELEKIEKSYKNFILIDHHRNLDKEYAITDESYKSNAELLEKILKEEGFEAPKEIVELGKLCDMGEINITNKLYLGKLKDNQKTVIEDVVTLINSDYRANWSANTAYSCLLNYSLLDILFARYPIINKLYEARTKVNEELRSLKHRIRVIDYDKFLYTEFHSKLYIQGLLATVLMLENEGKPVICVNRIGNNCYVELRAKNPEIDFGKVFFELANKLNIEAGGHKDAAGAFLHVYQLDKFLEELINSVENEAKG